MKKATIVSFFFSLLLVWTLRAQQPEVVEIKLATNGGYSFYVQKGGQVEASPKKASKFRILPGIKVSPFPSETRLVSLEHVGSKGHYLRHSWSKLVLHDRPKNDALFDADATFKMIPVGDGKVRFETINFPGMFITVLHDGMAVTAKNPAPDKSTYLLK